MKLALLFTLSFPLFSAGQDITSLLDFMNFVARPPATVLTVTATQGDGTVLTLNKAAGTSIYLSLLATNANGSIKTAALRDTGPQSTALYSFGDVICLFLINPTASAIPAVGSWTAIPAVGVGWQCSTNIRTAGVVTGQTALVAGAVSWP